MASEWATETVAEIASSESGGIAIGPFGSRMKSDCYVSSGVRVIRGTNLIGERTFEGDFVFISMEKAKTLGSSLLKPNDLIFPHRGSIGEVGIVPSDGADYVMSTSLMKLTCDRTKALPDFVYYFFKSPAGRNALLANESQVGTPGIGQPLTSLKSIRLSLPPISEQQSIVSMLMPLDDRLEQLKKANRFLEAVVQTIFKSWFVDFDPVRVKVEGREPEGMDAATIALFPDCFETFEGRDVPVGWKLTELAELMEVNPPRSLPKGVGAPYLEMSNVPTSGHRPSRWIERVPISGTRFRNGDTLVAKITPCLENGKTAFVDFLEPDQVGWGSTEFVVLTPRNPLPPEFGYLLARDPDFRAFAIQSMSGTSGRQRVQVNRLVKFQFPFAKAPIYSAFASIVRPIFRAIAQKDEYSKVLTELRDTLLPRLISGKLRVPEAEKLVEAVL